MANNFRQDYKNKPRDYFKVKRVLTKEEIKYWVNTIDKGGNTLHLNDRTGRLEVYRNEDLTTLYFVDGFVVDKNHSNGDEIHLINTFGLIYILNQRTKKLITVLGGRPGQIKRYYELSTNPITRDVAEVIKESQRNLEKGLNLV